MKRSSTVISLEEQMRGWLAEINRTPNVHNQILGYERLQSRVQFMAEWKMLPWNQEAADLFSKFRKQGIRLGTLDLKIACITLANDAKLITRNIFDFNTVPGLTIENWID